MADANQKALTKVQKVGRIFLYLSGAVFLIGIGPYLLMLLLMATRIIDPTLNPVGIGILFLLSCPVVIVLMLIGVFCRFLVSDAVYGLTRLSLT
jgi:hypothetical protein